MPYVRPHYRNGRYVRGHYRRSTPTTYRDSGKVWVSAHRRGDGTPVRGHWRNTGSAAGFEFSDLLWVVLLILLIIAVLKALA
jgi:hypothetical protein